MSQRAEHLKDEGTNAQVVLAGGIAGLVSRFVIAPLDVVKIRLQLQSHSLYAPSSIRNHHGPVYSGTVNTFRTIIHDEGPTALWKGNVPAELLYVCYSATQFTAYRSMTKLLNTLPQGMRLPDAAESFISGACAGGASTIVTYPLDLLRTRFAAAGTTKVYTGLIAGIKEIHESEGPRGFFRGCTAALGQVAPYIGLFFAGYEALKIPFADYPGGDAAAGVTASVAAKSTVFPLDTIRKRLQVQGPSRNKYAHRNIPIYNGIWSTFRTIVRTERTRGLYRGLGISLIKAAPASACTMWTYENALKLLRVANDEA